MNKSIKEDNKIDFLAHLQYNMRYECYKMSKII